MKPRSRFFASAVVAACATCLWAQPTPDAVAPQKPTPADTAQWRQQGRPLPQPELLQPTLDPALVPFEPRESRALAGSFKGASSDVLVDLGRRWIVAFQKFYPAARMELVPPFAGSLGTEELIAGDIDFVLV